MTSGKSGAIFLLHDDETLTEMREQPYESEALLQRLLAQHPALLPGELINRDSPRRWLLVRREAGVPSAENKADRWSMDHLFLDQEGVPTIVEVKRGSDTRIRREVVGQMLDYAANAVLYWPVDRIRSMFEENSTASGVEPDVALRELLGEASAADGDAIDDFWSAVERNFQSQRVRLIFVADVIPSELQRIVEFLNAQMRPAEVLAVEVRQYVGTGPKTLVPRVYGLTAEAQMQKQQRAAAMVEPAFLSLLPGEYAAAVQRFFEACRAQGLHLAWGTAGCSIRVSARDRQPLLSIAWVFEPGRSGWMGLIDVTLGIEMAGLEQSSPHLLDEARRYTDRVAAISGARRASAKGMVASSFSPAVFTTSVDLVVEAVLDAARRFGSSEAAV